MKIAFLIYSLDQGGAERVTSILVNRLASRGVAVTLFLMKPLTEHSYTLAPEVTVVVVSEHMAAFTTGSGILYNLPRIFYIRRLVKRSGSSVLYTMMTPSNILGALAMIGTRVQVVGSERNDPEKNPMTFPWRLLRRLSYRFSSAIIAQTSTSAEWLEQFTFAKNVVVIPNPVEFPLARANPVVDVPVVRKNMVLGVGRLCDQKQFTHLINAFEQLHREHEDWWLAIIGEGSDRDLLQTHIARLELCDRVRLIGRVGNMADWYEKAGVFVLTSKYEGYPNVLVEAMAMGVPVISYDCPSGPADLINDSMNGMLVPANDIDSLVVKMQVLMEQPDVVERVKRHSIKIRESLDADLILDEWLKACR